MKKRKPKNIPGWLRPIFAVVIWAEVCIFTVVFACMGMLCTPLSMIRDRGTGALLHWVSRLWAGSIMGLNPFWRLHVRGLENIRAGETYVIVANHQSAIDILVVLSTLPIHFKFLAKKEIFPIPFIGWHMFFAGYIPLDRRRRESGVKALEAARKWLTRGVSIILFPEGTRSENGQIQPFKSGAFKLARRVGVSVLPVVIHGSREALPKASFQIRQTRDLELSIGIPVKMAESPEAMRETIEKIRSQMKKELVNLRT